MHDQGILVQAFVKGSIESNIRSRKDNIETISWNLALELNQRYWICRIKIFDFSIRSE